MADKTKETTLVPFAQVIISANIDARSWSWTAVRRHKGYKDPRKLFAFAAETADGCAVVICPRKGDAKHGGFAGAYVFTDILYALELVPTTQRIICLLDDYPDWKIVAEGLSQLGCEYLYHSKGDALFDGLLEPTYTPSQISFDEVDKVSFTVRLDDVPDGGRHRLTGAVQTALIRAFHKEYGHGDADGAREGMFDAITCGRYAGEWFACDPETRYGYGAWTLAKQDVRIGGCDMSKAISDNYSRFRQLGRIWQKALDTSNAMLDKHSRRGFVEEGYSDLRFGYPEDSFPAQFADAADTLGIDILIDSWLDGVPADMVV